MNKFEYEKLEKHVFVTKLAGFEHSKYIQPNATHEKESATDIPMVQGKNIRDGIFVKKYDWYIKQEISQKLPRSILDKECILIPYVGSNLGEVGVFYNHEKCHLASNVAKIEITDNEYDLEYLKYYLQSPIGQQFLFKEKQGSTQPNITMQSIRDTLVIKRDIEAQKKISSLLLLLDKKIECNNKINDNLEQQMKLLYDYWFVQFDFPDENGQPYRSSGGKMVWNDELKREIPSDWEVKPLSELLLKNTNAFDYLSEQPTIDLSVMPSNSIALTEVNSSSNFATNLYWMKKGDILFGSIRPYLHKAGFAPCDGVVAGTVHSYKVRQSQDYNFALMTLCRDIFFDYAVNVSSGTKMPVVSSDAILSYKVAYSKDIVNQFNEAELINTIANNIQENLNLKSLRDWLLPMLMNGQAVIKD